MPSTRRFQNSWLLFRSSLHVMRQSPRLLLFPLFTAVCTVVIALFFFAPVLLVPTGHPWNTGPHWLAVAGHWGHFTHTGPHSQQWHPDAATYAYLALIYLASMICATFFNVAFYHQILRALAGGGVSLREGLEFACGRIRPILAWSLFAGLVGLLIKILEDRFGWFGRLAMRLVGLAWSVASVFAIPVMIREPNSNPLVLLRNSAGALKKTWGEALIGFVGIALGSWLLLAGVLLFVAMAALTVVWLHLPLLLIPLGAGWLLVVVSFSYLVNVANDIFRCALYVYASEGVVPEPYTADLMDAAWKVRKS